MKPTYLRVRYVSSRLNDGRLGITTTDERVARELGYDVVHYRRTHRAVSFAGIKRVMLRVAPRSNDALLDVGCGAGRVICMAAQYPFSRIVGVDIDERFCALAERNAQRLRRSRTRPEVVCTDATAYRVPDDITVVLLYNPFGGEMLRAALTRILESFDRVPRAVRIVYTNPREHELVMSMGRFREAGRLRLSWRPGTEWNRTQMVHFYQVVADGPT